MVACHQNQCRQNFNTPLLPSGTVAMALRYLPAVQQHLPLFQSGSTCGRIHSEERKGRKSQFLFTAQLLRKMNLAEIFSESRSGTITHKNKKKNYKERQHYWLLARQTLWRARILWEQCQLTQQRPQAAGDHRGEDI